MTTLLILFLAIAAGWFLRRSRIPKLHDGLLTTLVCVMLLLLGMSVGAGPKAVANLTVYGLNALIIGGVAAVGSAVAASAISRIVKSHRKEDRR